MLTVLRRVRATVLGIFAAQIIRASLVKNQEYLFGLPLIKHAQSLAKLAGTGVKWPHNQQHRIGMRDQHRGIVRGENGSAIQNDKILAFPQILHELPHPRVQKQALRMLVIGSAANIGQPRNIARLHDGLNFNIPA